MMDESTDKLTDERTDGPKDGIDRGLALSMGHAATKNAPRKNRLPRDTTGRPTEHRWRPDEPTRHPRPPPCPSDLRFETPHPLPWVDAIRHRDHGMQPGD
jgi:hypothetical protein